MAINFLQTTKFNDNVKLEFGDSTDLQIYHSGSNSFVRDLGTGSLYLDGSSVYIRANLNENAVVCLQNSEVQIFHNGSEKMATKSTGISVTGGVTTSSSSDMAGINMSSGLAMGNNNITGVNDITIGGTLTLNDELNMESGSDILMSASGNIQIDGDPGTGKFLKSVATGMEWTTITQNAGTVTSIGITAGTGISVSGSPVTSSGNITVTALNNGTVTSIATTSPITGGTITGSGTIALDQSAITSLSNLVETGIVAGGVWNTNTQLNKTSASAGDYQGEVVYWASTTVTRAKVYVYSGGDWVLADADAESTSKGTLAIALANGTSSSVGMLTRGTYTLTDLGNDGDILHLSTTACSLVVEPPSGSGDVVRIVGQLLDSSNGQIFFNPDNTFITLS